jgi:hypothetical protein
MSTSPCLGFLAAPFVRWRGLILAARNVVPTSMKPLHGRNLRPAIRASGAAESVERQSSLALRRNVSGFRRPPGQLPQCSQALSHSPKEMRKCLALLRLVTRPPPD